ncbi:ABC transporter permease [candidate division KSB1 bacterium]
MIRNYVKIAFRNILKYKFYSFVNIFGLGVAVGWAILSYVNYDFSRSYDRVHENYDYIYRIESKIENNDIVQDWALVPMAMGPAIINEIPGVERMVRVARGSGAIKYEDRVFNESFVYADYDFFKMFTFDFLKGEPTAFSNKETIIISERIAEKYFGQDEPVGETFTLLRDSSEIDFTIGGVIENPTNNSSLIIDILISHKYMLDSRGLDDSDWRTFSQAVFIQLEESASSENIENQIQKYVPIQNSTQEDYQVLSFYLDPLSNVAMSADDLRADILNDGMHIAAIIGPTVMGVMIMMLACFNFLHTAISTAGRRIREIGIRKVMGGFRRQLIVQFLTENILLCFFALIVGIGAAHIIVPFYDSLWPFWTFEITYADNIGFFVFLFLLLLITGFAAGAYPAFFVSKFNPVSIFRGKTNLGETGILKRILFIFQFSFTVVGLMMLFILNRNTEFQRNLDLGFDVDNILIVEIDGESDYNILKNAVERNPNVISTAGSPQFVGFMWNRYVVEKEGEETEVNLLHVGENYLETAGFSLVQGEFFDWTLSDEAENSILVNEILVDRFGWSEPLGEVLKINDREYVVRGVVQNFYHSSFWRDLEPFVLRRFPKKDYSFLVIRFDTENTAALASYVEQTWKDLFPERPYDGYFQDVVIAEPLQVNDSIRLAMLYSAVSSIIISGMGLFAIVSLSVARRKKEIGIRKVLGATSEKMAGLISVEFTIMLLISSVAGAAMGYYCADMLLGSVFAQIADFSLIPFFMSTIMLFLISLLTVGIQVYRASIANPVNSIRYE